MNNFGRYSVKLFLNGDLRVVEIDDLILYDNKGNTTS